MERTFGEVGTKLLFENDRVKVWELRLAPGEKERVHEHKRDYVMVQISGDRVAADFEPECGGTYTPGPDADSSMTSFPGWRSTHRRAASKRP